MKIKHDSLVQVFIRALLAAGYDVDQRPVVPGESLRGYDRTVVFMNKVNGWSGGVTYGALWALHQGRSLLAVDDWQIRAAFSSFGTYSRYADTKLWDGFLSAKWYFNDEAKANRLPIERTLECLTKPKLKWRLLVPLFEWGDESKLGLPCKARICRWDPTPFKFVPRIKHPDRKKKQWVLATLGRHERWVSKLGLSWPLVRFGKGFDTVPEDDVINAYVKNWGVVSPRYPTAGSGWWRGRFQYAAATRSVLLCDPDEIEPLKGSTFELTAAEIESLNPKNLKVLAAAQGRTFKRKVATRSKTIERLNQALRRRG